MKYIRNARFVAGPPSRYLATSRWMLKKETAGGGCMTNLGVHFIKDEQRRLLVLETGYAYPMDEELRRENRWTIVTDNGYYILAENKLEARVYGKETEIIPLNTDSDVYYPGSRI